MKPSSSAYISRVYLFIFLVSLSVTSIDWSSSSLLLGAAYVLWYLNKKLPLLFLFDPWIYISFFFISMDLHFNLKWFIHVNIFLTVLSDLGVQTLPIVMIFVCFLLLKLLCANFNFCRGNGYPTLWPSPNCTEPLDVSSNFTFEVIYGILSG